MKIVLLAHSSLLRRAVATYLARNQFHVYEASTGQAAIDLVVQHEVGVVICFWRDAGHMERDFIQQIRALSLNHYVFILLLANRSNDEWLLEGMRVGADDYMISPLNLKQLRRRVILGERIHRLETRIQSLQHDQANQLHRDTLTGMWSRQALLDRAAEAFATLQQSRRPLAVLMMAINNLRDLNDIYGYRAGDEVFRTVSNCVARSTREPDLIGRWSGSRLVVILANANEQVASTVAARIHANVQQPQLVFHDSAPVVIDISIGLSSTATTPGSDLHTLLEQADQACRQASRGDRKHLS